MITVHVSADERVPPWYAEVGWAHYETGWRLSRPPAARRGGRSFVVRISPERSAPYPCSARYALELGRAILDRHGRGAIRRPASAPRRTTFVCPPEHDTPELSRRVCAGLRALMAGTPLPAVPPPAEGKVRGVYLPSEVAEWLALQQRPKSRWIRAALAIDAQHTSGQS